MSTTEKYFKIKNGLQFDDGSTLTTAPSNSLVVEDTTPQLGGNLDINGNKIVSTSNGNIALEPNGSGKVTATTNIETTGDVKGKELYSTSSSGDEGGQINLAKPATGSSISGTGVVIDIYQNKLRIFEEGGSARGAYIDLTTAGTSVGTNLLAGGGSGITDIVQDTTPQLGGTLDANGNIIDMGTNNITDNKVGNWDTAYSWGNHSIAGYLTTETYTGTVTSVGGTGTVNGLTLSGSVTSTGNLTLGGTLNLSSPPAIGSTTASTGRFTNLTVTGTVTAGGSNGSSGQVLQSTGTGVQWATASGGGNNMILIHSGVEYITIGTSGTTQNWTLATAGGISGVSVSTNTFILPAGTYFLELPYTFSNGTSGYDFHLRNVTDSTNTATITSNTNTLSGVSKYVYWGFQTHFTIASAKTFRFQTGTANSFQANMGYTNNGKYTVKIMKY